MENLSYKAAGVNIEAGYEAVNMMKKHAAKTHAANFGSGGVLNGLGSFGGMFALPSGYKEPVLISGTDGVGTKLKLAFLTDVHNTVGIDCVAMCVNDVICQGAMPLFFLDYLATGVLEPEKAAAVVEGVAEGCLYAECALIGGETAEMPGFYGSGEYDLAGFAVGVAEKSKIIDGSRILAGDKLIAVASSGVHSNGFSLVRKICFEKMGFKVSDNISELGKSLGSELLTPTKIYAKLMKALRENFDLKGAAHITGGGWIENIPRMFNGGSLKAVVRKLKINSSTQIYQESIDSKEGLVTPPIFGLLKEWGGLSEDDMYNTFNMGVGLVLAVSADEAGGVIGTAAALGEHAFILGEVSERADGEPSIELI